MQVSQSKKHKEDASANNKHTKQSMLLNLLMYGAAWHDLSAEPVDPASSECLVAGLKGDKSTMLFTLSSYPSGEQVLCVANPGGQWRKINVAADVLASLRNTLQLSVDRTGGLEYDKWHTEEE